MDEIRFGTDGWRGIIAQDFTFANLEKVSQAVAAYLHGEGLASRGIVVGYDTRFMAEQFAAAVAHVMATQGVKVYLCKEAAPTPVVAYSILAQQAGGAVMLTASHNPPEYMGYKFIPEYAGPALPEVTDKIIRLLGTGGGTYGSAPVVELSPREDYYAFLAQQVDMAKIKESGLRFVLDPMYGAGLGYLEEILGGLGLAYTALHNQRDPLFGGEMPEPKEALLGEVIDLLRRGRGDMGLALDGDADRFGIIDSDGSYLVPNQVLCLLLRYLVEVRGLRGPVARTVATTTMLDRMTRTYGLEVIETPVGFKYQGQALLNQGAILAGEESGGLSIAGHIPEKDGILACLLMAEVRAHYGKALGQILADIYAQFGRLYSGRLDYRVAREQKAAVLAKLQGFRPDDIGGVAVTDIDCLDGWKFILADGSWLLVRASGTEAVFRIYGESEDRGRLVELQQALAAELGLD